MFWGRKRKDEVMAEEGTATIEDLLKPENVQIMDGVSDWREAVRISLAPLERGGFVETRYAENIIADTLEIGPYYVLTDDIALIHARPEEGALKKQLAVTLLRRPVSFGEGMNSVRVLFALAAEDPNSHIEAIRLLANFCMDEEKVKRLIACVSSEEIYCLIMDSTCE